MTIVVNNGKGMLASDKGGKHMTIAARKTYDEIVEKLQRLDDEQLIAIHTIVIGLVQNEYNSPLNIRTEEQLWGHIDQSVAQADAGIGEEADVVIDELVREFAL